MLTVYGIPNCNTIKKALDWLQAHGFVFDFHDYKKKGIAADKLQAWSNTLGYEQLLNKKGSTWRGLDEAEQKKAATLTGALQLMQEKTSLIKRPVLEKDGRIVAIGFAEAEYARLLSLS